MRLFAILAIFVLAIAAVVEGAVIVRLTSRVDDLSRDLAAQRPSIDVAAARAPARAAAPPSGGTSVVGTPRFLPPPASDEPPAPATEVLRAALDTNEGRQHLKAALDAIKEQEQQERMLRRSEKEVGRDQRRQEELARLLGLSPDERSKVAALYGTLDILRKRALEDMRAGGKTADQADDEIDKGEEQTEAAVRALLGEERMNRFREARRAERRAREGARPGPPQ